MPHILSVKTYLYGVDKGLCHGEPMLNGGDEWWRAMGEHSFSHWYLTMVLFISIYYIYIL
jgi:hypothetical protein